jgi:hypothetical protein
LSIKSWSERLFLKRLEFKRVESVLLAAKK